MKSGSFKASQDLCLSLTLQPDNPQVGRLNLDSVEINMSILLEEKVSNSKVSFNCVHAHLHLLQKSLVLSDMKNMSSCNF